MKVSILMSAIDRPTLANTLESWSNLTYPYEPEFLICDNGSEDPSKIYAEVMAHGLPITHYLRKEIPTVASVNWNELYKLCSGDFVIIAMQDEIISTPNIVECLLRSYQTGNRVSVITYELSQEMTKALNNMPWLNDAKMIEQLPGFWDEIVCEHKSNRDRTDAGLLTHITAQYREDWDYLGMFRWEEGYLLQDRDIVLRERVLGKPCVTAKGVVCYHQWHERKIAKKYIDGPSFTYRTEREARLLDPVEPDVKL